MAVHFQCRVLARKGSVKNLLRAEVLGGCGLETLVPRYISFLLQRNLHVTANVLQSKQAREGAQDEATVFL